MAANESRLESTVQDKQQKIYFTTPANAQQWPKNSGLVFQGPLLLHTRMSLLSLSGYQIKCLFWLIIYVVAIFPAKPHHRCPPFSKHLTSMSPLPLFPPFPSISTLFRLLMFANLMQP